MDFFEILAPRWQAMGYRVTSIRRFFTNDPLSPYDPGQTEIGAISRALSDPLTETVNLYYSPWHDQWTVQGPTVTGYTDSLLIMSVTKDFAGTSNIASWSFMFKTRRTICYSPSTKFWNVNVSDRYINFSTLNTGNVTLSEGTTIQPNATSAEAQVSLKDTLTVLKMNEDSSGTKLLSSPYVFNPLGIELVAQDLPSVGQLDFNRMRLAYEDGNSDGCPDLSEYPELFDDVYTPSWSSTSVNTLLLGNRYVMNVPKVSYQETLKEFDLIINGTRIPYISESTRGSIGVLGYWDFNSAYSNNDRVAAIDVFDSTGVAFTIPGNEPLLSVSYGGSGTVSLEIAPSAANYIDIGSKIIVNSTGNLPITLRVTAVSFIGTSFNVSVAEGIEQSQTDLTGGWISNIISCVNRRVVYFSRSTIVDDWVLEKNTFDVESKWLSDMTINLPAARLWKRLVGRRDLNFCWTHRASSFHLIDPAPTNIMDGFLITKSYFDDFRKWLKGTISVEPTPPTSLELKNSYLRLMNSKMISDSFILQSGKFKVLFGPKAAPSLQAYLSVIRPKSVTLTDNQFKSKVIDSVASFFSPLDWEFGETFYFTELAAKIHSDLGPEIDSVVLVPRSSGNQFGDMFQITPMEHEILYGYLTPSDIIIVSGYNTVNIRQ